MTPELIALLGGGASGFIMKMIAAQAESQSRQFEMMLKKQGAADDSSDRAANRGGVWMRRFITISVVFAIILVPTVISFTNVGVTLIEEGEGFLGLFKGIKQISADGYVILPEVRQAALAIVGFYFGSSQVR